MESWLDERRSLRRKTPALHYSKTPVFLIMAKALESKLQEEDKAPYFSAPTNGGDSVSLADF